MPQHVRYCNRISQNENSPIKYKRAKGALPLREGPLREVHVRSADNVNVMFSLPTT